MHYQGNDGVGVLLLCLVGMSLVIDKKNRFAIVLVLKNVAFTFHWY